jgi:hypothetical protein
VQVPARFEPWSIESSLRVASIVTEFGPTDATTIAIGLQEHVQLGANSREDLRQGAQVVEAVTVGEHLRRAWRQSVSPLEPITCSILEDCEVAVDRHQRWLTRPLSLAFRICEGLAI